MSKVVTIGVYGFDADTFLSALRDADARLLLDIRRRRGVRGAEYAWANARRLQAMLSDAGIDYHHLKELAPPTELLRLQHREDERQDVGKRSRRVLANEYARRYTSEILDRVDLDAIVAALPRDRATALLCVERDPEACHRSLVADRLASLRSVHIRHLRPP